MTVSDIKQYKKKIKWNFHEPAVLLKWEGIHTVCEESACPNRIECSSLRTATFLIGGNVCTRNCNFCKVGHGKPAAMDDLIKTEQKEIMTAVQSLGLKFAVITSITRDDDPESLARHFTEICCKLKMLNIGVELLIPDFRLNKNLLDTIASGSPDVIAHNLETVERLSPSIRPQASYKKSIEVLQHYLSNHPKISVKSGFMVGLGETTKEILQTLDDLCRIGVRMVTIGQYLRPGVNQTPVVKHYSEEEFLFIKQAALNMGITHVEAGVFTRSSYKAAAMFSNT